MERSKNSKFSVNRMLSATLALSFLSVIALSVNPYTTSDAAFTSSSQAKITAKSQTWTPTLAASAKDHTALVVSWPKLEFYTTYNVQWSLSSNFANPTTKTVTGTSVEAPDLIASTKYYFRAQAVGAPSAGWSATAVGETKEWPRYNVLSTGKWPSASDLDSQNNLWVTGYIDNIVKIVSPTGAVRNVGTLDAADIPAGITVVDDNLALLARANRNDATLNGVYSVNTSGVYKRVLTLKNAYGVAYDAKRNKVFVGANKDLLECDYATWACTTLATSGDNWGYMKLTPDGSKLLLAGRNTNTLSVMNVATKKITVLSAAPNLDVRSLGVIADNDYIAASASTGVIWRIRVNPTTGAVTQEELLTQVTYPLFISWDASRKWLYTGANEVDGRGVFKYTELIK